MSSANHFGGFPEFKRPDIGSFSLSKKAKSSPLLWTIIILVLILGGIYAMAFLWTDVAWYVQLGRQRVLFTNWIARALLFVLGFAIAAVIFYVNIFIASRKRDTYRPVSQSVASLREGIEPIRKLILVGIPMILAVFGGISLQTYWTTFVAWVNSVPFNETDPVFNVDIAFYVFSLPAWQSLIYVVLTALAISIVLTVAIYYVQGDVVLSAKDVSARARIHLSILLAIGALLIAARYFLSRYELLLNQYEKFAGASYADVNAVLPARNILVGISLVVAVLFVLGAFRKSWTLPVTGIAVMVASSALIGGAYPWLVQKFKVDPSAQELEAPYIQNNINATRKAFGIEGVEVTSYIAKQDVARGQLGADTASTASIRLLDPNVVATTFRQLEQNRQYYNFQQNLTVDRYMIDGKLQDTVIAVRELDQRGLGKSQRGWVNDHTVFTHGFGVVAAYGNRVSSDGSPDFWEKGIPSVGELGQYEPRIYFGLSSPSYSIVGGAKGSKPQEFDYPDDKQENAQVNNTYAGNGGPSIGNAWLRLLYALRFQSTEIFFSQQVNNESQILFDRNPMARVQKVAPYLTLDSKVYPAVVDMDDNPNTPKRVVWIVDGYTTSDSYPYSWHESLGEAVGDSLSVGNRSVLAADKRANYMRNSVKAVVDAYDGSVTLYRWDKNDPVLATWMNVFPNQVKPLEDIPADLMSHFRYPEDLFKVQRSLITRYHTTDARSFYSGSDFWKLPDDPTHEDVSATGVSRLQPPYYLTMRMPGQESTEFSLYSTYVPYGESDRNVLTGYLAVDSETGRDKGKIRDGYGKMRLLALPSDQAVPGPGQVSNRFKSTDRVATNLNLLAQNSTTVIRANLLTLPVGGGLLYVQPVYVQAKSGTTYPLLRSVLVSFGDKVGFKPTLQGALDEVFGGDSGAVTGEEPGAEGPSGQDQPGGAKAPEKPLDEQLAQALQDAKSAMEAGTKALSGGDWAGYGESQSRLQEAIERAVQLDSQISGSASQNQDSQGKESAKPEEKQNSGA